MATLQTMVDECRNTYIRTGVQPEMNRLASSIGTSDTSLSFLNAVGSMAVSGQIIGIDYEEIRVWQSSNTTATLVDRAANSSTAASHTSGAPVEVAPRHSQFRVAQAINDELNALSGEGLFSVGDVEVTYNPAIQGYDLGNISWDDILNIRYEIPGPSKNWPYIRSYSKIRLGDTTQFPTGNAIVVYEPGWAGLPIRVQYRGPFTALVNPTDDSVTVAGLPATAADIPVIGAAIRLTAGMEISRNFQRAQRDPMMMETIPPGAQLNAPRNLILLRAQRVQAEAARLARLYPRIGPR